MKKGRLKEIVAELQGASKMHLKQSKEIAAHIDDMASPAKMTSPLKKFGISGLFGLTQKIVPKNGKTIKAAADITFDDVAGAAWDLGSLALKGGANVTAMMLTPTKSYGGTYTDDPAWKAANPELQQDYLDNINWETEYALDLKRANEPLNEKYTNKDHPEYNALNEQTKYYEKEQYKKNNPPKKEPVYRTEADRALANSPGPWEDKLLAKLGRYGENGVEDGDGAPNETDEMLNKGIRTMNPIKKVRDHTNTSCWKSKVKIGTKMSRTNPGVRVNDCVDPSSPRAKNK